MDASGSGAAAAKRPWWRKKRWWLPPALFVWLVARWTVPWSLEGPAMSCFVAKPERASLVRNYVGKYGSSISGVSAYMARSGFALHSITFSEKMNGNAEYNIRLVYKNVFLHRACFPLWILAESYPEIIRIDVAGQKDWLRNVVAINGEKVDGGNQD